MNRSSLRRAWRRSALLTAATFLGTFLGVAAVGAIGAPGAGAATHPGRDAAPPQCTPAQVRITAATDHGAYPPHTTITMTSSIKNVSGSSCTVYLGLDPGFSPSFTVSNSAGTVVWDRCWTGDEPGACFEILEPKVLRPGHRFHQAATWDQGSGPDGGPVVQVPQGEYTFTTHYQYIGTARTTFDVLVG